MLTVAHNVTFTATVTLTDPGGGSVDREFTFRALGRKAARDLGERIDAAQHGDLPALHLEIVAEIDGEPATVEAMAEIFDWHYHAGREIFSAYLAALLRAREGN